MDVAKHTTTRNHAPAIREILARFVGNDNAVVIPKAFLEALDGDYAAAALLSQVLYWTPRTTNEGGWVAKTYDDWQSEIYLSKRRVAAAAERLQAAGMETAVRHWRGVPTVHYRIDPAKFAAWIAIISTSPLIVRKGEMDSDETLLSKVTQSHNPIDSVSYKDSGTEITAKGNPPAKQGKGKRPAEPPSLDNVKGWTAAQRKAFYTANRVFVDKLVAMWTQGDFITYGNLAVYQQRDYIETAGKLAAAGITPDDLKAFEINVRLNPKRFWADDLAPQTILQYVPAFLAAAQGLYTPDNLQQE